jgi:hypothetical protein
MNRDQQNFNNVQPPYDYQPPPPASDRFYPTDNTTIKEEYNSNGNNNGLYRSIGLDERDKRFE